MLILMYLYPMLYMPRITRMKSASAGGPRKFRSCWKTLCPYVICLKNSGASEACPSSPGINCSGCSLCSVMKCSMCVVQRVQKIFGFESKGCKSFRRSNLVRHVHTYHPTLISGQVISPRILYFSALKIKKNSVILLPTFRSLRKTG